MTELAIELEQPQFATERDPRLRLIIPIIVAIAFLMEQLDSTIITTAIPAIARSLDTTPVRLNLAITTYILTLAVFIPVSGWFADRFGARKVFALALFTFTLGSALCGMANSFGMLLAMRALQGLGGAMMTPVGRLILLRSFPRSGLITAMTYTTLPAIMGPVIGPLLGGLLTTYASWRWIFYVNVPFGCLGILAALRFVDDFREEAVQRFDFAGFLMVGCGVALLQFGLESIGRPIISVSATALVLAAAILLLLAFGRYARRVVAPAVDLTLFRFRSFWVGTLAGGLCRVGLNGVPFLLPLMLQVGFGMSPVTSVLADIRRQLRRLAHSAAAVAAVAALRFQCRADRQRGGWFRRCRGLRLDRSRYAALDDRPLRLCLRGHPVGAVHDLQHAFLRRPAGRQAQPRHQSRRRPAATQRFPGRFDRRHGAGPCRRRNPHRDSGTLPPGVPADRGHPVAVRPRLPVPACRGRRAGQRSCSIG
ncbi:MFS transporter [Mesorhizobium sp. M0715]|uniref:MFS transporter n=1 Tax=Mesorhizobium sp. M0715 TaxID=2956990 RepID=UPI003338C3FB